MGNAKRIVRAGESRGPQQPHSHPLNPNSEISGVALAALTGLTRLGVNLARVPPGKESFIYHRHLTEEEWIFILEGIGESEIDDVVEKVGPGDFVGYPAGVAHTLRNEGPTDLVYLMGGEHHDVELAEFPRAGKHLIRTAEGAFLVDAAHLKRLR